MLKSYAKLFKITAEPSQAEFDSLLKEYVGRPTPLYFAERLSKEYNTKVYLKEKIYATLAHIKSIIRTNFTCQAFG
jgi:tryptophan synthase beta subunit